MGKRPVALRDMEDVEGQVHVVELRVGAVIGEEEVVL
jgi:hypothetical protein